MKIDQTSISMDELINRFSQTYTGAVSDVLDQLGYKNQVLPTELHGLKPDTKLCGLALTVTGQPSKQDDKDKVFVPILRMLGDVKRNDIVITQANDVSCAHLGELSATAIRARGGLGAVIYGGVRDVDYIHKLGVPVFCRYTTPADVLGRWVLTDYNVPISIGNVDIFPGDLVFGDKDGVLIIPRQIAVEVLLKTEELVSTENSVRDDVENGVHPLDAYYKHGWF